MFVRQVSIECEQDPGAYGYTHYGNHHVSSDEGLWDQAHCRHRGHDAGRKAQQAIIGTHVQFAEKGHDPSTHTRCQSGDKAQQNSIDDSHLILSLASSFLHGRTTDLSAPRRRASSHIRPSIPWNKRLPLPAKQACI